VQHGEEAGALEDEDQRRHDGHAEDIAKVPGAEEHGPPGAGFDEEQRPGGSESAGEGGGSDDGNAEEAQERPTFGEVEGMAEPAGEDETGGDDLDGVGDGDADGERKGIAVDDVGEGVGEEADEEVPYPDVAGFGDDQGEEHAVGEPDGGDTFRLARKDDAEPGEGDQDEEGDQEA